MAKVLLSLSPNGFERLCQRILREVGFDEVVVTGRGGDGGIDGHGILRINKLVSDRVLFQCKRHADQISPSYIREFRGSMDGRADRGIFLATSNFSAEAKREAVRDGAVPIEMVDLDGLISLLTELGLGVTAQTAYRIDEAFFREYAPAPPSKDNEKAS
ncbi:MAG TPA: restriction endonuclease [Rhizomicrobium sp.]